MYGPRRDCNGKAKGRSTGLRKCSGAEKWERYQRFQAEGVFSAPSQAVAVFTAA